MWKSRPELACGFKAIFYKMMNDLEPHIGYYELLSSIQDKYYYFVTTSKIDGYFKRTGFDQNKIYEVHGSINYLQCMDKNCNNINGGVDTDNISTFDEEKFIADYCKNYIKNN